MIESFACKETEKIFRGERSRKFPGDVQQRARLRLIQLHTAAEINQLSLPPGNRLHALTGNLTGFWSISINRQWRLIFHWDGQNATDAKITDYH